MVSTPTIQDCLHLNHLPRVMSFVKRALIHCNDHNCADPLQPSVSLSDIQLPSPPSIISILNSRTISNHQTTKLMSTYERHISELCACTQAQIRNIISVLVDGKYPPHVIKIHVSRCIAIYQMHLDYWYQLFVAQLDKGDVVSDPAKFDAVGYLFRLISCYIHFEVIVIFRHTYLS